MAIATTQNLLTAEQFTELDDGGQTCELVRGKVVVMNPADYRHGELCIEIGAILRAYVKPRGLGRVVGNDSSVVTERDPDSVRGPDVAYISYARLPRGPLPRGISSAVPELVFEVLSPSDRRGKVLAKVAEFLNAGVGAVCVVDAESERISVYYADRAEQILTCEDELRFPEILGDFAYSVKQIFE